MVGISLKEKYDQFLVFMTTTRGKQLEHLLENIIDEESLQNP